MLRKEDWMMIQAQLEQGVYRRRSPAGESEAGAGPLRSALFGVPLRPPGHFLIRELLEPCIRAGMLDRHADEVPLAVEVNVDVLADLPRLGDLVFGKLDESGIGVRKILHSHWGISLYDLSKKAL